MAFTFLLRSTAILLAVIQLVSAKAVNYPVGVSLGAYHLSSAYYNTQNELIHITTINSSQEWRDYFWETWTDPTKHTPDYDPETLAMFTRTLKEIQNATERTLQLDSPLEYRSVTAPAHFIMRSSMSTLMRAAYDLGYFASGQSYQIINLLNAARLAYELDNCKGLGQPAGCDLDDEDYFALVVEYSERYLIVNFLNIGHYLCIPIESRRFPRNAEEENREHATESTGEGLTLAIKEFMDEMIQYLLESKIENPELKVRGIILAGEASSEGIEALKLVIGKALPGYQDRFLFDIDPGFVGVIGAAHRARQYVTEHAIMTPREGTVHEEL
ncbi:hypothetical protein BDZ45DRAFT_729870 [Acephala macrosclerotiorum]|nr:hypothetical protein BDZ45DRAFT_729870 [Acephala macrosclerotiorum]